MTFYVHKCEVCLVNEAKDGNFCSKECKKLWFESYLAVQKAFAKDKAYCYKCGACKTIGCEHFPKDEKDEN